MPPEYPPEYDVETLLPTAQAPLSALLREVAQMADGAPHELEMERRRRNFRWDAAEQLRRLLVSYCTLWGVVEIYLDGKEWEAHRQAGADLAADIQIQKALGK